MRFQETCLVISSKKDCSAVKPHYPLIKFRKSGARSDQVLAGQTPPTATATATKATSAAAPPSSKPIGSTARGTGIDESQLPARYARKPLSQYEGDYIQCVANKPGFEPDTCGTVPETPASATPSVATSRPLLVDGRDATLNAPVEDLFQALRLDLWGSTLPPSH
ncbi:hypothetical protein HPB47_026818 [Ixodes persulcatus]|uniref:Uncharacterized protein n=1 Tax=Ixodes persulcatus TaxID=34615 RepID=A0AC60PXL2_IXOPE|nr:hypothetical protein HPB47_026818 [Ixodes persulcatus]